jgi:hypothetical protein
MSKRKYILWTVKVRYEFPASECPESIDDWWDESGPDFTEWASCEDETLVCEGVSLEDLEFASDTRIDVTYVFHLSCDVGIDDADARATLDDIVTFQPPEGWTLETYDETEFKTYVR